MPVQRMFGAGCPECDRCGARHRNGDRANVTVIMGGRDGDADGCVPGGGVAVFEIDARRAVTGNPNFRQDFVRMDHRCQHSGEEVGSMDRPCPVGSRDDQFGVDGERGVSLLSDEA